MWFYEETDLFVHEKQNVKFIQLKSISAENQWAVKTKIDCSQGECFELFSEPFYSSVCGE